MLFQADDFFLGPYQNKRLPFLHIITLWSNLFDWYIWKKHPSMLESVFLIYLEQPVFRMVFFICYIGYVCLVRGMDSFAGDYWWYWGMDGFWMWILEGLGPGSEPLSQSFSRTCLDISSSQFFLSSSSKEKKEWSLADLIVMYYFIYFPRVVFLVCKTKKSTYPKMTNSLPKENAAIGKPKTIKIKIK